MLTRRSKRVRGLARDNVASRSMNDAKNAERSTLSIVNIAGNACTAVLFVIRSSCAQGASEIIVTSRRLPKAPRADSESQILAMKKFSCLMPRELICRSPRTVFGRIAPADSAGRGFLARRRNAARGGRSRQFSDAAISRRRQPPPRRSPFRCRVWT